MKALTARGERTRRKLLESAERIFAELGYHDASIVKITEAAGVGQGTFYLYFASKKEIFEVVLDLNSRVRHAMTEAAEQVDARGAASCSASGASSASPRSIRPSTGSSGRRSSSPRDDAGALRAPDAPYAAGLEQAMGRARSSRATPRCSPGA